MTLVSTAAKGGGGGGAPSGPAGGDLAGNYPNPTVSSAKLTAATFAPQVFVPPMLTPGALNLSDPLVANQAVLSVFFVPITVTINRIQLWVNAQNGNVDLGLYDDDGAAGAPSTRLASTGSIACTAPGVTPVAIGPTTLTPGRYYTALAADNAVATFFHTDDSQAMQAIQTTQYQMAAAFPLPATVVAVAGTAKRQWFAFASVV